MAFFVDDVAICFRSRSLDIHVIEMHLQQAVNAIRPYRHTSVSGAVHDALCHIGLKAEAAMDSVDMQNWQKFTGAGAVSNTLMSS